MIFDDNSFSIGHTPLVRLHRITDGAPISLLAKLEGRNPAHSVKDRIGASMVWDAEQRGVLIPGKELIEPTSGNTGIALAFVGAARGYPVTLVMPEGYSAEFQHSAKLFGARLLLTEPSSGMYGAILKAEEAVASDPDRYVLLNQFINPANPAIHFKTTGPEIWDQTDGKIDVLVAGIGTGGTITGVARYIKQTQGKGIISIGVEPAASPTITQVINKQPLTGRAHGIQGLGAGFIPDTLDLTLVDHIELVTDDEALDTCRRLGREEGITAGISSGAVMAVAVRIGKRPEFKGKTIVVVLPDGGERYLNTVLFDGAVNKTEKSLSVPVSEGTKMAAPQRAALPDQYGSHGAGI
jgi:cysteine synthase A